MAAVSANSVIGVNNDIPWKLSADMRRFRELTICKTVVMGRKTWDSFPKKPLPNRKNIILTRDKTLSIQDCENTWIASDVQSVLDFHSEDLIIIGGGEIYKQFLPYATHFELTRVSKTIDIPSVWEEEKGRATFFPVINLLDWRLISNSWHTADEKNECNYEFLSYERIID